MAAPINIYGMGIYSCLAQWVDDLYEALRDHTIATPDNLPPISDTNLHLMGIPTSKARQFSQAERYALYAAIHAMDGTFMRCTAATVTDVSPSATNGESQSVTLDHTGHPLQWRTGKARIGLITACDAATLPHQEVITHLQSQDTASHVTVRSTDAATLLPSRLALQCMTSGVATRLAPIVGANAFAINVGAACASGHMALQTAQLYLNADLADYVVVIGVAETGSVAHSAFNALHIGGVYPSGGAAAMVLGRGTDPRLSPGRHGNNAYSNAAHVTSPTAQICGIGITHAAAVTPDADAMATVMNSAIYDASISPHNIDIANLHHSGSQLGNAAEDRAMQQVFDGMMPRTYSTKRQHGHEMWMSGISQVIETALLLQMQHTYAVVNSFGLNGTYASLVMK